MQPHGLPNAVRYCTRAPLKGPDPWRELVIASFAGAFGLALWGCDLGSINFSSNFRYDSKFANPSLTASATEALIGVEFREESLAVIWRRLRGRADPNDRRLLKE